jgi:hypothetical protein
VPKQDSEYDVPPDPFAGTANGASGVDTDLMDTLLDLIGNTAKLTTLLRESGKYTGEIKSRLQYFIDQVAALPKLPEGAPPAGFKKPLTKQKK